MSSSLRPWSPEDFADSCETCGAPPGQFCHPWCPTGFTAADARHEAGRYDENERRNR